MKQSSLSTEVEGSSWKKKEANAERQSFIMTRDKSIYPLNGISLPRIPPSCWRQIAQSSRSSSRACSCSWQFRLLPQASRRSSAAATSSFSPLFPPSMPGCCCDVCCDSHWMVCNFRSACILNMDARTCWENTRIWESSWMLDIRISDWLFVLKRNSRISPYIPLHLAFQESLVSICIGNQLSCPHAGTSNSHHLPTQRLNERLGQHNATNRHHSTCTVDTNTLRASH